MVPYTEYGDARGLQRRWWWLCDMWVKKGLGNEFWKIFLAHTEEKYPQIHLFEEIWKWVCDVEEKTLILLCWFYVDNDDGENWGGVLTTEKGIEEIIFYVKRLENRNFLLIKF